ncbi:4-(cytidine 5'-diphospho)-2-C-methyl-D-erythritol kinase [Corynebacterium nuruki]|uniref:4-(cytidine 5'-diphospho)-2-C-methyl-D-erythritol kinase n=1 Tax=Corynebacterium nuruki TaxID=1032851 RepID=UPI0002485A3C|nr:4-(cytidine 5'-diphospho)-2-C-methyl-D-erythritol kinase [Corynebacterium nuruki]
MTAPDADQDPSLGWTVSATAQGKVNLHLAVGARRPDGYHDLETVFQALDLTETVTLTVVGTCGPGEGPGDMVAGVTVTGRDAHLVPAGGRSGDIADNLAVRAVRAVAASGTSSGAVDAAAPLPRIRIDIDKGVPVAGGMAGGSADAAAALLAARALLGSRHSDADLTALAADLGADVPFCLLGGTALGQGRGDRLVPVMSRGTFHWALATGARGLPTPEVFARLDEQRAAVATGGRPDVRTGGPTALQRALVGGDPVALAGCLSNDLQAAAVSLRPELRRTLAASREAGALGAVVSGSGPTVAMLCRDREHAVDVATAVAASGDAGSTLVAASSPHGARLC